METLKEKISEDRGSVMVEAASVFPIVIFSMAVLVFILAIMYSQTAANVEMHMALNKAMGKETETVTVKSRVPEQENIGTGYTGGRKVWKSRSSINREGLLFMAGFQKDLEGRVYEVHEKKFIRYKDLLDGE